MTAGTRSVFAAVDLGASSGRVIAGLLEGDKVHLRNVHRFENRPHERDGHLRWHMQGLYDEILVGLGRVAAEYPDVSSIGVDTWGVDYALLDGDGRMLAEPIAYRDARTSGEVVDGVHDRIGRDELYRRTGVQLLPFNTIYQLAAEQHDKLWAEARHIAMLPDLIANWLTGELRTEATIASTTGLIDLETGAWATDVLERLEYAPELFPPIERAGTVRGTVLADVCARLGLPSAMVVTTVGSHDTASAVAGIPATNSRFAYVSSGTWSLVGLELGEPVVTDAAQAANFTNERGVDGRIRFLRNVGGLWLLNGCRRAWAEAGRTYDLESLVAAADSMPDEGFRIDVDDPAFLVPGDMPARIGERVGAALTPAQAVRCIVDSLADAYARTVRAACELAQLDIDVVHIVGGGSQIGSLCRRTADAIGVPVVAGPVEATALGNIVVQARTHGSLGPSLEALRSTIAGSVAVRRFEPSGAGAVR